MAAPSDYDMVDQAKSEEHKLCSTKTTERPWRPGMLRQLPWTGLLALFLGFGCGVATLTIALVSNGKPLDYWSVSSYSVQPTVLLAILVTLTNVLFSYALASGIAVFWWSSALAGRTLRQLNASQSRGDSLMALFTLRPVFNAVTVASLLTILLLMDQPLFQRGIRVVARISGESRNMSIPISPSPLQEGTTGIIPGFSSSETPELFHPLFAEIVRQYQNRDLIKFRLPECKGRCDFDLISPGWEIDCTEWETSYRLMAESDYLMNMQDSHQYTGPPVEQTAFSVNITYHPGPSNPFVPYPFHINTSVMYKATRGANGTMRWRNCTFTEALIAYPVTFSNGNDTLRLKAMPLGTNRTTHRILRRFEPATISDLPSTLGGIWRAIVYQFAAQATVSYVGPRTKIDALDIASNTYMQASNNGALDDENYTPMWSDPTDDMISMAHELTLRTAIATTNTLVITAQNRDAYQKAPYLLTGRQPEIGWPNLTLVNRTLS